MTWAISLFAAAAAFAPVPTAADPFRDDVSLLAAAAEEPNPFASLRARAFRPRPLADYCFPNDAHG